MKLNESFIFISNFLASFIFLNKLARKVMKISVQHLEEITYVMIWYEIYITKYKFNGKVFILFFSSLFVSGSWRFGSKVCSGWIVSVWRPTNQWPARSSNREREKLKRSLHWPDQSVAIPSLPCLAPTTNTYLGSILSIFQNS